MGAFEVAEIRQLLAQAINGMPEREKIVLTLYYYESLTLQEIGQVLGVTESRVCQIHTKAVLQLRSPARRPRARTRLTARTRRPPPVAPASGARPLRRGAFPHDAVPATRPSTVVVAPSPHASRPPSCAIALGRGRRPTVGAVAARRRRPPRRRPALPATGRRAR